MTIENGTAADIARRGALIAEIRTNGGPAAVELADHLESLDVESNLRGLLSDLIDAWESLAVQRERTGLTVNASTLMSCAQSLRQVLARFGT